MEEEKNKGIEEVRRSGNVHKRIRQTKTAEEDQGRATGLKEQAVRAEGTRREAKRLKRSVETRWESEWWYDVAQETEEAEEKGDVTGTALVKNKIKQRGGHR